MASSQSAKGCGEVEGELEYQPHGGKKNRDAEVAVQHDPVDLLGQFHLPQLRLSQHFAGEAGGQGVAGIGHNRLDVLAVGLFQVPECLVNGSITANVDPLRQMPVSFHQLQHQPAFRVSAEQVRMAYLQR